MSTSSNQDRAVFLEAIELHSPETRADYLDRVCAGDPDLRARVDRLIQSHELLGTFHDDPGLAAATINGSVTEKSGDTIGPYKLLQQIGEGGMGVVFMAEQSKPIQRTVALKIIKPGMDTREVIARFEAERQALAMMDHPNIAKVFDAGTTDTPPLPPGEGRGEGALNLAPRSSLLAPHAGRPYFVMELVQGVPITEYCDQCNLTTRERLELFITVCQAVQHAHQKGVIHRDIKPTNVLVSIQDGKPSPKIIDFGVAKAINQQQLTERTLMTAYAQIIGTPLYMSPEQAELSPLGADTRSDIYSLGVLLYELLTGTTPFDKDRFQSLAYDDLRRVIREEDPPRPSTRLSTLDAHIANTVADRRQTESKKLILTVRGDLDWIVMKCLEKDRNRRYETTSALQADIRRHLASEPVEASPPSAGYRLRKFARRNRGRLAMATILLLTIVVGWSAATVLIARERNAARAAAGEAERERKRAEENLLKAKQAVDTWFTQVANDLDGQPHTTNIQRALLEQALEFYKEFMKQKSDDPVILRETALAYQRVGYIYGELGRNEESVQNAQEAARLFLKLSAANPDNSELKHRLADSYLLLGIRRFFAGELEAAPVATAKANAIWKRLARQHPTNPEYHRFAARSHVALANQLARFGPRLAEAEAHGREALARWGQFRKQFPELAMRPFEDAHAHHWLASVLVKSERYEEVEHHLRRAVELRNEMIARGPHPVSLKAQLAWAKVYLGMELLRKGSFESSEDELKGAKELLQPLVDNYPDVAEWRRYLRESYEKLTLALFSQGRYEEAELSARNALALLVSDRDMGWPQYNFGLIVHRTGKVQEAADMFRAAIKQAEAAADASPEDSNQHRRALNALHWMLTTCPLPQFHDPPRGFEIAKWFAQRDPESAESWGDLGIALYRLGKFDDSVDALSKAMELRHSADPVCSYFLAMSHWQRGDLDDAVDRYRKANEIKEVNYGANNPELLNLRLQAEKLLGVTNDESHAAVHSEVRTEELHDKNIDKSR